MSTETGLEHANTGLFGWLAWLGYQHLICLKWAIFYAGVFYLSRIGAQIAGWELVRRGEIEAACALPDALK